MLGVDERSEHPKRGVANTIDPLSPSSGTGPLNSAIAPETVDERAPINSPLVSVVHNPSIINHQSSIINHQSSIINHQPSIITHRFLERRLTGSRESSREREMIQTESMHLRENALCSRGRDEDDLKIRRMFVVGCECDLDVFDRSIDCDFDLIFDDRSIVWNRDTNIDLSRVDQIRSEDEKKRSEDGIDLIPIEERKKERANGLTRVHSLERLTAASALMSPNPYL